jgi:hypothetical protein
MRGYKTGLAFLVTPLIPLCAALASYGFNTGAFPPVRAIRGILIFYGPLAYIVTAVFGIPAFRLLRSSPVGGKLSAAVCGGVIALVTGFVLFALVPGFFVRDNGEGYIKWGITGAVSGLVFWVIATRRKAAEARANAPPHGEI